MTIDNFDRAAISTTNKCIDTLFWHMMVVVLSICVLGFNEQYFHTHCQNVT